MNIILCGFMGSGKSTVGKKLAKSIGYTFIDLDDYIEKQRNMSITDIFSKYGEENFRESETQSVKDISKLTNQVISLGGGTVLNPLNVEILKQYGKIFLLNVSPECVYERLKYDNKRPLLQTDDKLKKITELLEKRMPIYKQSADFIIETDNKSAEDVAKAIIEKINF